MTPMMKQYFEIKDQYADYILFYRLGDFYEMFFEDAQIASRELELALTGRECGEEQKAPMCGVPYHSCEPYIGKLIEKGYKVAICEQTEDPAAAKGIVKREVIRVITPGTVIESDLLEDDKNNYLCTVYSDGESVGICFADISTAYICATSVESSSVDEGVMSELSTYSPREILSNIPIKELPSAAEFIKNRTSALLTDGATRYFNVSKCLETVSSHFPEEETDGKPRAALIAVGAALGYIEETQMKDTSYIRSLSTYDSSEFLEMDVSTRRNLELCETMLSKEKKGSLLWVLDKTETAMGVRLLKKYIEHPLTSVRAINDRQSAVAELCDNFMLREELRALLVNVLDLERLVTKVTYGTASGRDLRAIAETLRVIPSVKELLADITSGELSTIYRDLDTLEDIFEAIDKALVAAPPFSVREGKMIADGYNEEVDRLRYVLSNGTQWLKQAESAEREKTGLKTLKIGYNRVFGYYIEAPRWAKDQIPENYIRKQTLSDKERYITDELKEMEATLLGAGDKVCSLEYELFCALRERVAEAEVRIRASADALARLDVFISFAESATQNNYVRPEVDEGDTVSIRDGRHPVVERFVRDTYFVPNDAYLNTTDNKFALITGPNMAGKSTYMRQTALIILMAQIGSFVPASDARIGIVDKLFTRVGASDDLASGQSTFMLEMKEVAYILNNATKRSFIIYDEIGRGTSTYDGMSIAKAVVEYTAGRKLGAKTMFATHYHELTDMEGKIPGIVNYNIAAKKRGESVTFLRKIVKGPADDSYGIEVARLAGVPTEITRRAKEILRELESGENQKTAKVNEDTVQTGDGTISIMESAAESIADKIRNTDINTLTPIEAMNMIFEWKRELM